MSRSLRCVALLCSAALVGSCGDDPTADGAQAASDLPAAIECGTQYRPDADTLEDVEERVVIAQRDDGITPQAETVVFETMTLHVAYAGDSPEGRNVRLRVSDEDDNELFATLYQVSSGDQLRTQFAGGHGFTGLNYVHHGGASLQVWCTAT